jgi:hypothetical protein
MSPLRQRMIEYLTGQIPDTQPPIPTLADGGHLTDSRLP